MCSQLFRSFSLAAPLFVPSCHPRRHGGINFLCRAKLNYQVFKRDRRGGRRGEIRARGLQPAPNRARGFNSINYLNRQRLANTPPSLLRTQANRCNFPPKSPFSFPLFLLPSAIRNPSRQCAKRSYYASLIHGHCGIIISV